MPKFPASISTSENLDLDLMECKLELFDLEVGKELIDEEVEYYLQVIPG